MQKKLTLLLISLSLLINSKLNAQCSLDCFELKSRVVQISQEPSVPLINCPIKICINQNVKCDDMVCKLPEICSTILPNQSSFVFSYYEPKCITNCTIEPPIVTFSNQNNEGTVTTLNERKSNSVI